MRRAAGAQQIERGIHRGLVRSTRKRTQRQRPKRIKRTLDWRKSSKRKIREKRLNFRRNLAVDRHLKRLVHRNSTSS